MHLLHKCLSYGRIYPLSVIRVWDVRDMNMKAEACNLHCGILWDDLICYIIEKMQTWSWSIKLVQFHIADGLPGDQKDRH